MIVELITKKNCPKCDWVKENVLPALELKGHDIVISEVSTYPMSFYKSHNLNSIPIFLFRVEGTLHILDKGLTFKNVAKFIESFK